MKILCIAKEVDEPTDCCCSSCSNEYDAVDLKLSLGKGFSINITLCDDCVRRLQKIISIERTK
jgi:hypothetical protein